MEIFTIFLHYPSSDPAQYARTNSVKIADFMNENEPESWDCVQRIYSNMVAVDYLNSIFPRTQRAYVNLILWFGVHTAQQQQKQRSTQICMFYVGQKVFS